MLAPQRATFTASIALLLCSLFFASSMAQILYWPDSLGIAERATGSTTLALFIVALVIVLEGLIALLLLRLPWWRWGSLMAAFVLIGCTALAFIGSSQNLLTVCPCFGHAFSMEIGWPLAASNGVLLLGSIAVARGASSEEKREAAQQAYGWLLNQGTFLLVLVNIFLFGVVLMTTARP